MDSGGCMDTVKVAWTLWWLDGHCGGCMDTVVVMWTLWWLYGHCGGCMDTVMHGVQWLLHALPGTNLRAGRSSLDDCKPTSSLHVTPATVEERRPRLLPPCHPCHCWRATAPPHTLSARSRKSQNPSA
eukprot:365441-Chlamydomonas_euryale.AAC.20